MENRSEVTHGKGAVVDRNGTPGAGKASRGAQLGVVLGNHEVGTRLAICAKHLREHVENRLGLSKRVSYLGGLRLDLLDGRGELRDVRLGQRVDGVERPLDGGRCLVNGGNNGRDGLHVKRAVVHDVRELLARDALRYGHEGVVHEGRRGRTQRLDRAHVLPHHGKVRGELPERRGHLDVQGVAVLDDGVHRVVEGFRVTALDGFLKGRELGDHVLRVPLGRHGRAVELEGAGAAHRDDGHDDKANDETHVRVMTTPVVVPAVASMCGLGLVVATREPLVLAIVGSEMGSQGKPLFMSGI